MSILADIVARKRIDVAERKRQSPAGALAQIGPSVRSLERVLRLPGPRFIFECKKASPSEGVICPHYDPAAIAVAYREVADAISVLTDAPYFHGSFEHLRTVRARVEQPILCKDFVVDPFQVREARAAGADAVLLMLSVLSDAEYRDCAAVAEELAMGVLTEVRDEIEVSRAVSLGARIIGINNRNLDTLQVDPATTARLAPLIPRDRVIVCESGMRSRADLDAVCGYVDAFLVGSHLMKSARLDLATRELMYGRVKVCGLTTPAQARLAYDAGASLGGVIFARESKRCVDIGTACAIAADSPLPLVGVFVNEAPEHIAELASELGLHAVQLHGEEETAEIDLLRRSLPEHCEIWKATRVRERLPDFSEPDVDRWLLDGFVPGMRGGTGERFDWRMLEDCRRKDRIVLAGGIDRNTARRAQAIGCHALDVNSGVESVPGVKDETMMRQLFATLRGLQ